MQGILDLKSGEKAIIRGRYGVICSANVDLHLEIFCDVRDVEEEDSDDKRLMPAWASASGCACRAKPF